MFEKEIRILHVDDDEEDYLIIKDLLSDISRQKYNLDWASGYEAALQKLKLSEYDICLIDFILGNRTGIDLLKKIRELKYNIPVIIFTGQGDEEIDIEAMESGAADYLVKGQIDGNVLERSIRYSINQARIQQQLLEQEQNLRVSEKFAVTGRVAQVIAHEVRNPLTNLVLAVQQLEDELTVSEEHTYFFDLIKRNCTRINQLIINLLDSTKFVELRFEDASVNEIVDDAIHLASDRMELKHIRVVRDYSSDVCEIYADREKLKIALLNVIINATEAVSELGGEIVFKTRRKNDKCIITICDNGKGIEQEELLKIFEPFYTKKNDGTGLGLTNSQNIILNHKGSIKVESKPGDGTAFIITLDISPNKRKVITL